MTITTITLTHDTAVQALKLLNLYTKDEQVVSDLKAMYEAVYPGCTAEVYIQRTEVSPFEDALKYTFSVKMYPQT